MKLRTLLFLVCTCMVRAQCDPNFVDMRPVPLGALSATVKQKQESGTLEVAAVTPGGPGAQAGLLPGDFIYGVNGERLPLAGRPHEEGIRGALSEMGYAIERAESTTGALSLQILRPGSGALNLSATLPVLPGLTRADMAWRPSFPVGDPRMLAFYEKTCADIHVKIQAAAFFPTTPVVAYPGGGSDYYGPFYGLTLLAHPNWNSSAGPLPYRLSINKLRDRSLAYLATRVLSPVQPADPGYQDQGYDNWYVTMHGMFLAEYRRKTGDTAVNAAVQRTAEVIANRIQQNNDSLMGHGGVSLVYAYNGGGLNIINAHAMLAMGMLKGAGADFSQPSGTSGLTINQKYLNNWDRLKRSTYIYDGTNEELKVRDGNVAYGITPSGGVPGNGCGGGWDSNARTPCTAVGYEIYRAAGGTAAGPEDLLTLGRIKSYTPRNWQKQHNNHGYSTAGTVFSQMVLPFVSDREQRYFRENSRFLYTLGRDHTGAVVWVPGRNNLTFGDIVLGPDNVSYMQPGMAWAVASGNLPSFPAPASAASRVFVRMNSPRNDWPQLAARRVRTESMVLDLDLDVTNYQGNVMASGYTAVWSQLSGVAATFTTTSTLDTRVTFPVCGDYRLRLVVTAGGYTAIEEYDFEVMNSSSPPDLSAAIVQQPVSRSGVPGGCAAFSTIVSGGGPFIYEWRKNGVPVGVSGASSTLTLTNLSAGSAGTYQCTIYHPGGQLVSAPATLTISAAVSVMPGGLKREVWYSGGGIAVTALTGQAAYPLCPDTTGMVPAAEGPQDVGVLYGQKLSGWVVAPVTGTYKFYLACNDAGELWLSTTSSPAGKTRIVNITVFTDFREYSAGASADITLTAGQRYYIEALQVNGGGATDFLSIAWKKPGDAVPANGSAPIPGAYLEYEKVTVDPEFDGLVSRWNFDEATGTTARDAMGTANDGALTGPAWVTGRRGAGLLFDTTDRIVCTNAGALSGLTPFTVTAWVKVNAGANTEQVILQQRDTNGFDGEYIFLVRATGKVGILCYGNGNPQFDFSGAKSVNDGLWHHVAAMRDAAGGARIYVDGQLDGSVTGTTVRNLDATIKVGIGADIRDNNRSFRGVIDDVRIYNRDLTANQVFALASTGEWSTAPWTGDASAGIRSDTKWAWHFGAAGNTVINECIVTGVAGANPSTADFTITGVGGFYNGDDNSLTPATGTGSATVAKDFIYGGNPATITLQGLKPGRRHVLTVLSMGWDATDPRQVIFASGGDSMVVEQNQYGNNNGLRVTYAFTPDAATRVITVTPVAATPTFTFHFYALALWQQPFVVANTADSGGGSLRQALADAAASPGKDNITFDPVLNGQTINLGSEIVVSDIDGVTVDAASLPGGVAVSGGYMTRVLYLSNGGTLMLRRLTLTGGNGVGAQSSGKGGAVCNSSGTLVMDRCTLAGNSSQQGGALFSSTSAVTGQLASSTLLNYCTLFDNAAAVNGGAVNNFNGQTTLVHCTVSCNYAPAGAGVISFGDSQTRTAARYCIIAGNGASDVDYSSSSNSYLSQGFNFIGSGNATGSFIVAGDSINHTAATIKLSPAGPFGGPSWTMALLPGSPAREAATGTPDKFDQRGFPIVGLPDSGAYEAGTLTNYNAWIYETLPVIATITQHGGAVDFDGDGFSNEDEYILGTNPGSSASTFGISTVVDGSDWKLVFSSVPGRTYTLQQTPSLEAATWTAVAGVSPKTGNGTVQNFIVPRAGTGSPARLFYRIRVMLTP